MGCVSCVSAVSEHLQPQMIRYDNEAETSPLITRLQSKLGSAVTSHRVYLKIKCS